MHGCLAEVLAPYAALGGLLNDQAAKQAAAHHPGQAQVGLQLLHLRLRKALVSRLLGLYQNILVSVVLVNSRCVKLK